MSIEVTGGEPERFEFVATSSGCELLGEGRLRKLAVDFADGWLTPRTLSDEVVGVALEHETGVQAHVKFSSGARLRVTVALESTSNDVVTVPGPVLLAVGQRPAVGWFAGASGEVVLPGDRGPGLLTQRRGACVPSEVDGSCYLLAESVTLAPRQLVSAAWTYEALPGDILDVPPEPTDLPLVRYVPCGHAVEFSAPDGMVSVPESCRVSEADGEFEVYPAEGFATVQVWGAGGATEVEVGGYRELSELRAAAMRLPGVSDEWCYVAVRHLLEAEVDEALLDRVDWLLGQAEGRPSAWAACSAQLAVNLGLPLGDVASEMATQVVARGRADDVLLLMLHGLITAEEAVGRWPLGDFDEIGLEAVAALRYGRIHTQRPLESGRDVTVARLWAAGLGETEPGLRAAAYAGAAQVRLLCGLSARSNLSDLAWLSVG